MSKTEKVSINEARKIVLNTQGLTANTAFNTPLEVVERLGYIQIDTISVVERTHHHTLQSRFHGYKHHDLHEMLTNDRSIFEYWSHAASYLPMKDYRFSLYRKHEFIKGEGHWQDKDKKVMRYVLKRIRQEGPLQSKDFDDSLGRKRSAWSWKPAKRALEQLFMEGQLMTTARVGFQKVYDLTERVLPSAVETKRPTKKEFCRYLIETTLRAHGIAKQKEIQYGRKGLQPTLSNTLKDMISEGSIRKVSLEGYEDMYFAFSDMLESGSDAVLSDRVYILSPFDNLIIQRDRARELFGYDYLLECYVPEKKRKYGYFCLSLFYQDRFAGRLDAKADRKANIFEIKNIWLETAFQTTGEFLQALAQSILDYSKFCGCDQINVSKTEPKSFQKELRIALDKL